MQMNRIGPRAAMVGGYALVMDVISSRHNPLIQRLRRLRERPSERREQGLAVLDGEHLVSDWLAAGQPLQQVLLGAKRAAEAPAWQARGVPVVLIAEHCLSAVSAVDTPAGVMALVEVPAPRPVARGSVLALDAVQDPGNVGALLRTAAAFGVDQVWLGGGCADAWAPKVLRAAQGAHARLAPCERVDLAAALGDYRGRVVALDPDGGAPPHQLDLQGDIALLLGAEGHGLHAGLRALAQARVSICMPGATESLNVAMAAGIVLYERWRQGAAATPL